MPFRHCRVLQKKLIVTKVPREVYSDVASKTLFENVFRHFDNACSFVYLPSFSRVLVTMSSTEAAFMARFETQGWRLPKTTNSSPHTDGTENHLNEASAEQGIRCYFAEIDDQDVQSARPRPKLALGAAGASVKQTSFEDEELTDENTEEEIDEGYLAPPKPSRLFLLSPPASPPVGWEPRVEAEPCINYDLLSAIASMEPGKTHELHPPCTERQHPSIVVTPCESLASKGGLRITPTACPRRTE
uniref:Calcipressin-2 n=1 Tax=Schistocephalus solidus TaxID=70667 RepID=A0A0X3PGZ7_SCHSO